VVPDPDLIWRLKPEAEGDLATNELGFRDTHYNDRADDKILLLGDSVSWGDSITDVRRCYPFVLEQELAAGDPAHSYEVINTGVPGYSTFQEARYLQKYGLALNPKLIVLQFCLNDVVERYSTLAEYGGNSLFLGIDTRKSIPGLLGVAVRHSRAAEMLMRYVQNRSRQRETYDVQQLAKDELSVELEAAWQRTIGEIETIRLTAEQHKIPFLLVITPYQFQMEDPSRLRQPQQRLLDYAKAKGIPCVDLLPLFVETARVNGIAGRELFNDANHFSVYGHEAAAKLLVEPVRRILRSGPGH
jgi:lysophospholipase L1-like esterase